jgi:hypothetical protein
MEQVVSVERKVVPIELSQISCSLFDQVAIFFFLLELILRRDPRLAALLKKFESKEAGDSAFLEKIHQLIRKNFHFGC